MDEVDLGRQLEESLERMRQAMQQRARQGDFAAAILAQTGAHVLDRLSAKLERAQQREARRHERRAQRWARMQEWHGTAPWGGAHPPFARGGGAIRRFVIGAAMAAAGLVLHLHPAMVGVGIALGLSGLVQLLIQRRRAARDAERITAERAAAERGTAERTVAETQTGATGPHDRESRDARSSEPVAVAPSTAGVAAPATEIDPEAARIDALCEQLLAEIKGGPPVLRTVVREPDKTIASLRAAYHEVRRRAAELRAATSPAEVKRLHDSQAALNERLAAATDEIVRDRIKGALAALEQQLEATQHLETAAARLDAEALRISCTLDSLRAQLLRARAAGTGAGADDVAGASLHKTLTDLTQEIEAVAEALEWSGGSPVPTAAAAESEADRARRAAAARAAQRS